MAFLLWWLSWMMFSIGPGIAGDDPSALVSAFGLGITLALMGTAVYIGREIRLAGAKKKED